MTNETSSSPERTVADYMAMPSEQRIALINQYRVRSMNKEKFTAAELHEVLRLLRAQRKSRSPAAAKAAAVAAEPTEAAKELGSLLGSL